MDTNLLVRHGKGDWFGLASGPFHGWFGWLNLSIGVSLSVLLDLHLSQGFRQQLGGFGTDMELHRIWGFFSLGVSAFGGVLDGMGSEIKSNRLDILRSSPFLLRFRDGRIDGRMTDG